MPDIYGAKITTGAEIVRKIREQELEQVVRDQSNKMHAFGSVETVLEEANRIIYGDREQTYGHPSKNFDATASLWNGYLDAKYGGAGSGVSINATDVAHMMMLLKMARELHIHKRDNVVDMAGYAGCIQKMHDYVEKDKQYYEGF